MTIIIIAFVLIACGGDDKLTNTTPETFTVTFHANGGTPEPEKQTIEKGKTATEPQGVTKANNTLDGWYKENAFTTKWNFATDTVTANVDFYAKWVLVDDKFREFKDIVMFTDTPTGATEPVDYKADIKDARTGAREKTLEELGIVEKLQDTTIGAYNSGTGPTGNTLKARFRNIFGDGVSKVTIFIDDTLDYESSKVESRFVLRFDIEYLLKVSDSDLQSAIIAAVTEMNGKVAMLENKSVILHIVFA
jgi:uncharacterized repeat protein (TIGR02543 family)